MFIIHYRKYLSKGSKVIFDDPPIHGVLALDNIEIPNRAQDLTIPLPLPAIHALLGMKHDEDRSIF